MNKIGIYLIALTGTLSLNAAPLVSIGEKVDIFFNASLSESYNSNLYSQHEDPIDDFITTFDVGLTAEYGRNTKFSATAGFNESFLWYSSETHLDNDLFSAFLTANYAGDRLKSSFAFYYKQQQQNSGTIGEAPDGSRIPDLVRYDDFNINLKNTYDLTAKINMDLNLYYTGQYYKNYTDVYSDTETFTLPLSILYAVTDKVRAGFTFQYRNTDFQGGSSASSEYGNNRDDFFFGLNVRGEFSSKLSANIYFGGTYRVYNNAASYIDDELTMALSAALNYTVSDKLVTSLNISRDFGSGASRQSMIDTSVALSANYVYSSFLRFNAAIAYVNSDYQYDNNRTDDSISPSISMTYIPIKNLSLVLGYNYYSNLSTLDTSEYDRHLLSFSAKFRY